jgi:flagellar biosynthetic protein FliP
MNKKWIFAVLLGMCGVMAVSSLWAAGSSGDIAQAVNAMKSPQKIATSMQILTILTVLTIAPSILVMVTSFTRIIIVLSLLRQALSMPQMPPNTVLIGLALFLTFFIMAPTFSAINRDALQPYIKGQMTEEAAYKKGVEPLRSFMIRQTRKKDLALFINLAKLPKPKQYTDVPTFVVVPAFIISELKTAFEMGFMIYIPFMVVDMLIAGVLMSMGMMMVPPTMFSLPFKILLFVLIDGWNLIMRGLVMSFR